MNEDEIIDAGGNTDVLPAEPVLIDVDDAVAVLNAAEGVAPKKIKRLKKRRVSFVRLLLDVKHEAETLVHDLANADGSLNEALLETVRASAEALIVGGIGPEGVPVPTLDEISQILLAAVTVAPPASNIDDTLVGGNADDTLDANADDTVFGGV